MNLSFSKLKEIEETLLETGYFKGIVAAIAESLKKTEIGQLEHIVCFGIGNFLESKSSQHQLSFVLAIRKIFGVTNRIIFHEPILRSEAKELLRDFDCFVEENNYVAKVLLNPNTFAFLPHCPKQLTNNLLWTNEKVILKKSLFFCNSFDTLVVQTPERLLKQEALCILTVNKFVTEVSVKNHYPLKTVFNDISLHSFENLEFNPKDRVAEVLTTKDSDLILNNDN